MRCSSCWPTLYSSWPTTAGLRSSAWVSSTSCPVSITMQIWTPRSLLVLVTNVADSGCLSRIRDPDFHTSRIPDPKTATKERGEKIFFFHTFFFSHKFHKIESYFIFEMLKKKIWVNFPRIIEVFTQKTFTKLSKIWVWDPGSRSRAQKGTGSRIRNTACYHIEG